MARAIVITGGGTGGHVFPMLAVGEHLRQAGVSAGDLRFVGSRRGKERELLRDSDVAVTLLPGRGIQRSMAPRSLWDNVIAVVALAAAILEAVWLMVKWRPRAVVSVGGYAALAADVAAVLTRRPLVLIELDAAPSATHQLVRRFARRVCTALPSDNPRAQTTGLPLRASIEAVDRSESRVRRIENADASNQRWTIVVMTGSLGAGSVNRTVAQLAQRWRDRDDIRLVHVTGERDFESTRALWDFDADSALEYEIVAFADMAPLWALADLGVCRAGATTVAELTYLGIPSVLVPLPGAPGDHQTKNARTLEVVGAAVIVADRDLNVQRLAQIIEPLLETPDALIAMSHGALSLRRENAGAAIARVVLEAAA